MKSSCPYNEKQISALRKESKEISDAKHKIKMAARYQRKKKEIAMNYDKIEGAMVEFGTQNFLELNFKNDKITKDEFAKTYDQMVPMVRLEYN